MKIKYFSAERQFNNTFEKFFINGYTTVLKKYFSTIITKIQPEEEIPTSDESCIIIKDGSTFYKIETTLDNNQQKEITLDNNQQKEITLDNTNQQKEILFDYNSYGIPPVVFMAFIGSIVTCL